MLPQPLPFSFGGSCRYRCRLPALCAEIVSKAVSTRTQIKSPNVARLSLPYPPDWPRPAPTYILASTPVLSFGPVFKLPSPVYFWGRRPPAIAA
ncbi:hypothetical protein HYPDE_32863 [Hyphomicrobium denitrificans 1NES1]|uniref:Uncharacterized protein n=1 Tax=Hyphomicrobium denitrificans 1NES1 TaxID=670307 RepID=N0BDN7_9HYPH|nr:hypothetical protein HYPDE_32863 [Hyphomicrobium denitrificans 1NES1]